MSYFPCRCSNQKCRQRVTLRMHPNQYVNLQKCELCGSPLSLDSHRKKRSKKDAHNTCTCDQVYYPHRAGSLRACVQYVELAVEKALRGTARPALTQTECDTGYPF